jgi:hypothetical protein
VPDTRAHRGPDPRDAQAFGEASRPAVRSAVADLSLLLGRGYAPVSSLKLVGDRWQLTERQRRAVRRAACSDEARERRLARQTTPGAVAGEELIIDGFNVLTTIEAALGGAVVLICRDTTCRDIAGIHGSYRKVVETLPALERVADVLRELGVRRCHWLFDRPVSNSGRIGSVVLQRGVDLSLTWTVELVANPDGILRTTSQVVASADSDVLDSGPRWFNLARIVVETACAAAMIVDLSGSGFASVGGDSSSHPAPEC